MKKLSRLAILVICLIGIVFAITACDKENEISIEAVNLPQTVFVEGNELNLAGGMLTVSKNGVTEEITLDSEGVLVTGYNKSVLGDQTLTVTYQEKSADCTVTVVPRVVVENAETKYFVGEQFNKKQGRLKITNDDGTSFTVPMSDEKVSATCDFATAGETSVSVRYLDGNADYTGSFAVTVYEIKNITLRAPVKISYYSHETDGISLDGGYLSLRGGSGAPSRDIALSEDMISGFDLSAAKYENREEPLQQRITVSYAGLNQTYTIYIRFSNVSLFQMRAQELSVLDFSTGIPEITDEQWEYAAEAVEAYLSMTPAEQALLGEEELENIARPAAVYAKTKWAADIGNYSNAITFDENGNLYFSCPSPEETRVDYEKLNASADLPIKVYGKYVSDIVSAFGDVVFMEAQYEGTEVITEQQLVKNYLASVFDSENLTIAIDMVRYMLELYDTLTEVPESWSAETVINYADEIASAYSLINTSGYKTSRSLHRIVERWDEDFFEIIYTYIYEVISGEEVEDAVKQHAGTMLALLQNVYLPGQLEELYQLMSGAVTQIIYMSKGYQPDTTIFMWYYDDALKLFNEIISAGDMYSVYCASLSFSGLLYNSEGQPVAVSFANLLSFLRTTTYGYVYLNGALFGDDEYTDLWVKYLTFVGNVSTQEGFVDSEEFDRAVEDIFNNFVALSPAKQYGFLESLNTYYSQGVPSAAFNYLTEYGPYTYFVRVLAIHYHEVLPESVLPAFPSLLLAMESYSQRYISEGAYQYFISSMESLQEFFADEKFAAGGANAEDKAVFDAYLGEVYGKYVEIYERVKDRMVDVENGGEEGDTTEEDTETVSETAYLGEWQTSFDSLIESVTNCYLAYVLLNYGMAPMGLYLATYEETVQLSHVILESNSSEAKAAYYYDEFTLKMGTVSLDFAMYYLRNIYISILTQSVGSNLLFDFYETADSAVEGVQEAGAFKAFLADAAYIYWTYLWADPDAETLDVDMTKVLGAMQSYRALSAYAQYLFVILDSTSSGGSLYYEALNGIFAKTLTADAAAVAKLLLNVESAYVAYNFISDEVDKAKVLETLKSAMAALQTAYTSLSKESEDGEVSDYDSFANTLGAVYEYYCIVYDEAVNEAADDGTTTDDEEVAEVA